MSEVEKEFPEILQDSDSMSYDSNENKELVPVTIEEELPATKIVDGYSEEETNIINKARGLRDTLITKLTSSGVPRGKELEMTVALINDQESSAHKTSSTRLKVKSEDTKAVVASSIMNFLFDEKNKQTASSDGNVNTLSIELPDEFVPNDIVEGETSDIVKNNDFNVDDYMPTEREL